MLRVRVGQKTPRRRELQAEDLASVLQHLEEEFVAGERLADEQTWCMPVPRARQVRTVQRFYRAFHDAGTLPVLTCKVCYRKRSREELRNGVERWPWRSPVTEGGRSLFACRSCFPEGRAVPVCAECARCLGRERASPGMHLHGRLGCEHAYPDELKGLTPVEEKLISLNSCYGFVTRYSIPGGQRQSVSPGYGRDPCLVAGAEKPGPRDLSGLLSVRRRAVERALVWQENNPLYGEVEIDVAEMESWGSAARGAVVPPTERAMDDEGAVEIEEILVMLSQGGIPRRSRDVRPTCDDEEDGARPEEGGEGWRTPRRFASPATPSGRRSARPRRPRTWVGTAAGGAARGGDGDKYEPYIQVRRGNEFADSADASFFAKTFPTLFPFGVGGPRLADEAATRGSETTGWRGRAAEAERVAEGLTSTRNMNLKHGPTSCYGATAAGVTRKNFAKVEGLLKSLTTQRLEAARVELEATGKTGDDGVKELLRSLSVFGHRQPMSRESRLRTAYKRVRLAIADPMSAAVFFHREIKLFFEHYVDVGDESVFGHVGAYYGAVETNERGALHLHGLLWLKGNARLGEALAGAGGEEQAAYRERIIRYVDSVFSEELDAEGHHAVQAERSITAHMSSWLDDVERFTDAFDEEANFCAGATQVHTHSATCVKYSLAGAGRKGDLCRFKAPWRLVERTALTADGVLEIRRTHSMVNRWNKAMAVGLRHNHDISFIATQRKTMALIYYITNYATKVEDPTWKRVAAAAELLPTLEPTAESSIPSADRNDSGGNGAGEEAAADPIRGNKTRVFLLKAANRIFTERPLSQVEVIADLLGYPRSFAAARRGQATASDAPDETVVVEEAGPRISFIEAYRHRGGLLQGLCLYDYASLVRLKRNGGGAEGCAAWGEIPFNESWAPGRTGRNKEFGEEDEESCHRRAAVQHLALFVPWEAFVCEETGDINDIWARERAALAPRIARLADNVQLLRRSAEDAKRDARQWAATTEEGEPAAAARANEGAEEAAEGGGQVYRAGGAGDAARLIDVFRNAAGAGQVTARSAELLAMTQQLCRFQQSALSSAAELDATVVAGEAGPRRVILAGSTLSGAALPRQEQVRAIKSQQRSAARSGAGDPRNPGRRGGVGARGRPSAALRGVMGGFGEDDVEVTAADADAGMRSIALLIICRQLDQARQGGDAGDSGDAGQLCLFVGGEGEDLSSQLLITATSGTAAARINGITLHSACGLLVGQGGQAGGSAREVDGVRLPGQGERFVDGRSRMDWQEKEVLVIDELCRLRGSPRDFGGIPVVILCGDFHQFRPVQERSILLPSAAVPWDADGAFAAERRRQHDKAHALWRKFTTVVMLDEQMRAAGDRSYGGCSGGSGGGSRTEAALAFRARQRTAARIFVSEHKWRDGTPTEEEAVLMLGQGDDSATPVPAVFLFVPGMPVVVNQNTHQGLKLVNGAGYTAVDVIPDRAFPGHRVSAELTMHFGPPVGMVLASETTKDFHFVGMPSGTILLTPISVKIQAQRKRPWQRNDVSRRGLPCAAAFACTDYKVQGGTLERVALELRGARTTTVDGRAVPSPCDPYSLYVQLSRCPTLDGIMLVSEVRRGTW
ncbi:ATP-dependent DNA helicase PIF1 [Hirsutella rhossiliensis]|uniref:ATP-dependent DNA helicase PIF1 n=1 Tax=Hirsutella rhossiliensis TaxID=111463 RepID=A0A9P8MLR7_9HYPO|nr:ATP-dependent DNA helicase PIF1 [Hirsutella rhossiliensis]KAH0957662.1 ATP-dependent DNA helicase PIF1 [Hirsutella rhossiliensis]